MFAIVDYKGRFWNEGFTDWNDSIEDATIYDSWGSAIFGLRAENEAVPLDLEEYANGLRYRIACLDMESNRTDDCALRLRERLAQCDAVTVTV